MQGRLDIGAVDGDHATGNWRLTISLTPKDQASILIGGVFDDIYVRTNEGWRIKRSRFSLAIHVEHHGLSWAGAGSGLASSAGQYAGKYG